MGTTTEAYHIEMRFRNIVKILSSGRNELEVGSFGQINTPSSSFVICHSDLIRISAFGFRIFHAKQQKASDIAIQSSPSNNAPMPQLPKIAIVGRPNVGKSSL